MAIINVPDKDSFDLWRQKTNLISQTMGDLTLLNTTDKSNLVAAINEVLSGTADNQRRVLIRAIAMS